LLRPDQFQPLQHRTDRTVHQGRDDRTVRQGRAAAIRPPARPGLLLLQFAA
jgi:hypothetical protein